MEIVKAKGFIWSMSFKEGVYAIRQNGYTYSHTIQGKNNVPPTTGFNYSTGHIVRVSYDPENKKIILLNKNTGTTDSLDISI